MCSTAQHSMSQDESHLVSMSHIGSHDWIDQQGHLGVEFSERLSVRTVRVLSHALERRLNHHRVHHMA
jgi:hypothetical protein